MKKTVILGVTALSLFLVSCFFGAEFVKTGKTYPPLARTAHVDVIMRAVPTYKFEQIGIVTVRAGDLTYQIEKVKEIARKNGANVVILTESKQGIDGSASRITGTASVTTYDIRTFEIGKQVR